MFLSKADLAPFATKADLASAIAPFATKADLAIAESHFKADISALEARLAKAMIGQTYAILGGIAAMAAVAGLILSIARPRPLRPANASGAFWPRRRPGGWGGRIERGALPPRPRNSTFVCCYTVTI
jgi:hypothetical protein